MADLTARELTVVQLAAAGLNKQQMAARMFLAVPTVSRYLARATEKLGARNRAHLVARAYDAGILAVGASA